MSPSRLTTILLVVAVALGASIPVGASARPGVSVDDARAKAEATRAELNEGAARVDAARAAYYEIENAITDLEADLEAAEANAEELRGVARDRARDAYTGGNLDLGDTLESDDVLDAARKTQFLEQLKADDDDKVEQLGAVEEDLDRRRAELDDKKDEQAVALEKMEAEIADLERKAAEAESVLAEAEEQARIEAERRAAEEAARAEAAARASREQAAAAAAASAQQTAAPAPAPAPSGPSGNLGGSPGGPGNILCPFPGHSGFSDSYGDPRSGHSHQGVDIGGPYGGALVAVVSGTVSFSNMGGGGNGATLAGSDGNIYRYMHLSSYGKGGAVSAGDVIGYNGATGNANGFNHLHFEVHPGGAGPTNPYPWVAPVC